MNQQTIDNPTTNLPVETVPDSSTDQLQNALSRLQVSLSRQHARWFRSANGIGVDYRDRISVATWLVVFGLGLSVLVELPSIVLSSWAFGSPISIPFTGNITFVLFLAIMAAAGAQSVVSIHPVFMETRSRQRISTWAYWALPMALTSIAVVMLPAAPGRVIQIAELVVSAIVISISYYGLYMTVDLETAEGKQARLMLDFLAYGSALLLFLFVYQTRTRSLLSGSLIALIATLLALEVLRTSIERPLTALVYGGIIGLILGEATWALNYWRLPNLTGGLLLLLTFYLLIGITQQGLQGRLTWRVLVEFGVFALLALFLIAWVGPGFGFS